MRNVGARKCAKMRTVKGLRSLSSLFRLGKGRGTVLLWVNHNNRYISGYMFIYEIGFGRNGGGSPRKDNPLRKYSKKYIDKTKILW